MTNQAENLDAKAAKAELDDYTNVVTALGTAKDKSSSTRFGAHADLGTAELDNLYEHEPLAARIVDRVVDDGTREGWDVTGSDPAFNYAELGDGLDAIETNEAVADAWRWARLYGGSIIIVVVNDNQPMQNPIDFARANRILGLHVIESPFATPRNFRPGLGSRAFRHPEAYDVLAPGGSLAKTIHSSRVIRVEGIRVPPTRIVARGGWPPSILDRVWSDLKRLGSTMGYAEAILHELSIMVLKLADFRTRATGSGQSKAQLQKAVETMRSFIDNLHTLVMDTADEYVESSRSVAGLDALIGRFVDALVRATDMPRTILLGEQPAGMNASADSEIRAWFDFVSSQQRLIVEPILARIVGTDLLLRAKRGETPPTDWAIEFNSLWQPTEKEQAETGLLKAQGAQILIASEVVAPDEMRAKLVAEGMVESLPTLEPAGVPVSVTAADPAVVPAAGGSTGSKVVLAPTDVAIITRVNEGREASGLAPLSEEEGGKMFIAQFKAQQEAEGAAVGAAVGEAEGEVAAEEIDPAAPTGEPALGG